MRTLFAKMAMAAILAVGMPMLAMTAARGRTVETIAFVRHGEKPPLGLGQLDCKGLNRALALPQAIAKLFSQKPAAIFAPDPGETKQDSGVAYNYVRPLATIEPTAIALGMPVNTSFGVSKIDALRTAFEQPALRGALVLVAWEHKQIEKIVGALLIAHGGDPTTVPKWQSDDFDSIFVVTIDWSGGAGKAGFSIQHEGLDGQPDSCPN